MAVLKCLLTIGLRKPTTDNQNNKTAYNNGIEAENP